MKKNIQFLQKESVIYILIFFLSGVVAYLLFANQLGLMGDDWYLVYDYHTQGIGFFQTVFSIDRPERAYLLQIFFSLFGENFIYFHIVGCIFRVLASTFLFFSLCLVWEKNKAVNFLIALLFLIYPGFLSQVQPVDYIDKITGLFFCMFSIYLSLLNIKNHYPLAIQITLFTFSVLLGWSYLGFVEYFIPFEVVRYFLMACLVINNNSGLNRKVLLKRAAFQISPYLLIAAGFLFWRFFIFHNMRNATDLDLQLSFLFDSPLLTGLRWIKNSIFGLVNVIVSVWIVPFYRYVINSELRLKDLFLVLGISAGVTVLLSLGLRALRKKGVITVIEPDKRRSIQFLVGGVIISIAGILPIIIANRAIDFDGSRYTLAASLGGLLLLFYGISQLKSKRVYAIVVSVIFMLGLTTQLANAVNYIDQTNSMRDFWWQVSWRVPQIQTDTMLIAQYYEVDTPENYLVWGPANLIYYPEIGEQNPIDVPLSAALLDNETINAVIGNAAGYEVITRGVHVDMDFGPILVMTQSAADSCVHILDGSIPEFSTDDSSEVRVLAAYSSIDTIIPSASNPDVPHSIFGDEPEYGWCYYYQRAALARQTQDWELIISLMDEALDEGFYPNDRIEWMPLLQAYTAAGQTEELESFISIMTEYPIYGTETCSILLDTAVTERPSDAETSVFIQTNFCR